MRDVYATLTLFGSTIVCVAAVAQPAAAKTDLKGQNLEIIVAGSAAGSYAYHVRMLEPYLKKHIPGQPTIVVKHMPGAGGIKAANYLYNVAPADGHVVGTLLKTIAVNQAIGRNGVKYDAEKFGWIISTGPIDSVLALWKATTPAKTLEEAKKTEVVLGSTGKGSATFIEPALMNSLFGTKFNIITGYNGLGPVHVALENGEIQGRYASVESLFCCKKNWLRDDKLLFLAQSGLVRNDAIPSVPTMVQIATREKDKKFLEFFGAASTLGRIYVAPPDVPEDALGSLREGFWAAAHDPAYVKQMKERGLEYKPVRGEEAKKSALVSLHADPDIIARAKKIMGTD